MPAAKYRLNTCVWELTLACTYSCIHCGPRAGRSREGELTLPEALDLVSQLMNSIGDVRGCESLYDACYIEGNLREKPLATLRLLP